MPEVTRWRFSRIDVIVLIVVVLILLALLAMWLPGTGHGIGSRSRLSCANNLRQLGQAILQVVNNSPNQQFPGYRNILAQNVNPQNARVGSWVTVILPGLQQGPLYQKFRDPTSDRTTWKVPYLEILVCPGNPPETYPEPALDYVVNCGKPDNVYQDKSANGLFFDRTIPKPINSTLAKIVDGAEHTLMLSENRDLAKLLDPQTGWGDPLPTEARFGFVWWSDDKKNGAPYAFRKINGVVDAKSTTSWAVPTPDDWARPASNHKGGVNVCFASGRETFLRDDIAYYVYQQLMTPDGANSDPPAVDGGGSPYILDEADYRN